MLYAKSSLLIFVPVFFTVVLNVATVERAKIHNCMYCKQATSLQA